jgi:hypothetical protein
LVLSGLVGWCGTPPKPRPPIPKDPFVGFIGGVAGGLLVYWALGFEGTPTATQFFAIAIGAFAGGRVLSDIVDFVLPGRKPS